MYERDPAPSDSIRGSWRETFEEPWLVWWVAMDSTTMLCYFDPLGVLPHVVPAHIRLQSYLLATIIKGQTIEVWILLSSQRRRKKHLRSVQWRWMGRYAHQLWKWIFPSGASTFAFQEGSQKSSAKPEHRYLMWHERISKEKQKKTYRKPTFRKVNKACRYKRDSDRGYLLRFRQRESGMACKHIGSIFVRWAS